MTTRKLNKNPDCGKNYVPIRAQTFKSHTLSLIPKSWQYMTVNV